MEQMFYFQDTALGYGHQIILDQVTFSVNQGEIFSLIGPNGAGKSTILKHMMQQLAPIRGCVLFQGKSISVYKERELAKQMAMVFTKRPKTEYVTCEEMVATGRYPYTNGLGILGKRDWDLVEQALEKVHLTEKKDRDFETLSDGQKQLCMLARALCQQPKVLILDEPTSFLDIRYKMEVMDVLQRLVREEQVTVIMSLHELDLAMKVSHRLLCVKEGKLAGIGTPEELFQKGFVQELYQLKKGVFLEEMGTVEFLAPTGEATTFVIGGGGSGISTYYQLMREGTPFYAGILMPNDREYLVAKSLAKKVFTTEPFSMPTQEMIEQAKQVMRKCENVICTVQEFGSLNEYNQRLQNYGKELGILWQK